MKSRSRRHGLALRSARTELPYPLIVAALTALPLLAAGCTSGVLPRPPDGAAEAAPDLFTAADLLEARLQNVRCAEGGDFSARFTRSSLQRGLGAMVSVHSAPERLPGLVAYGGTGLLLRANDGRGVLGAPQQIGFFIGGGAVSADYDGDGEQDIAIAQGQGVAVLRGLGRWRFDTQSVYERADNISLNLYEGIATADVNRDGLPDIICPTQFTLLINRGKLKFDLLSDPRVRGPTGLLVEDLNQDGWPDMAVWHPYLPPGEDVGRGLCSLAVRGNLRKPPYFDGVDTMYPQPWAEFPLSGSYPESVHNRSKVALDFDGDGRRDVAVVFNEGFDLMLNRTRGDTFAFERRTAYGAGTVWELAVGDLNRDGRPDFVGGSYAHCVNVWLGEANGTFRWGVLAMPGPMPHILVDDFNGDGWPDIVANEYGGPIDGSPPPPPTNRWYQHVWTNLGKW